nr:LysR family transcriptional regulator [Streptococcus infantarius]
MTSFLTLYETLNYTETAERLYISQGNVSKQIMALEKGFCCKVFQKIYFIVKLRKKTERTE